MPRKENAFVSQANPVIKKSDHYDDSKNDETIDAIPDWFEADMEIGRELDVVIDSFNKVRCMHFCAS